MNLAVCDDQTEALNELEEVLKRFPFVKKVHIYSDISVALVSLRIRSDWTFLKRHPQHKRLSESFLTCHKSYVVNMEQILEFRNGEIWLSYDIPKPPCNQFNHTHGNHKKR